MSTKTKPTRLRTKSYSITELANVYTVTPRTMKLWLSPHADAIGQKIGRFFNVKQVEIIFDKLGIPDAYDNNE
jgi:hypothetical protein